jgi:hypothetical protein
MLLRTNLQIRDKNGRFKKFEDSREARDIAKRPVWLDAALLLLEPQCLDQRRECSGLLPPARVVQKESREWWAPVFEHPHEARVQGGAQLVPRI